MDEQALRDLQEKFDRQFPLGIPRKSIGIATGGVLHPRTMANEDSLGTGIEDRFRIGSQTVYPVSSVVDLIRKKICPVRSRVQGHRCRR